jgi:hypothetical protein
VDLIDRWPRRDVERLLVSIAERKIGDAFWRTDRSDVLAVGCDNQSTFQHKNLARALLPTEILTCWRLS